MARGGINKAIVQKARNSLLARDIHPSIDAVRIELGNTGSKTTIHRYLKELEDAERGRDAALIPLSEQLANLVSQLADQLEEEAQAAVAQEREQLARERLDYQHRFRQAENRGCKPETQKFPSADQHGLSRAWSMSSCIARMTSSWVYDLALGSSASRRASSTSRVIRAYSSGHSACSMRSDACPSRCSRPNSRMSLVATTCSRIRSWITSQARCASGVAVPS